MRNKLLSIIVILALVAIGILLFVSRGVAPSETGVELGMPVLGEEGEGVSEMVVEVSLDSVPFEYSEETITVSRGDTVRITLNNVQGTHDLRIEGYDVGTEVLQAGESETFEFVASEAGEFEYYCSVGTHRQMGMVGKLIVN